MRDIVSAIRAPFLIDGRVSKIVVAIFIAINSIVLYNAIAHVFYVGYDAPAHVRNITILSKFRLPTQHDTYMFYMPPLTYLPSALLLSTKAVTLPIAAKFAQLLNVLYSLGLTLYFLKICDMIRPRSLFFKASSLLMLGMLPVYYKTFAFIRGEGLLTFLALVALYMTVKIFVRDEYAKSRSIILGVASGLMLLTRQTGLFVLIAILIFIGIRAYQWPSKRRLMIDAAATALLTAFAIGGWFYLNLYERYGGAATYNVPKKKMFSLANQPRNFYLGLGDGKLFTDPVRESFKNQAIPIFYSELWGDYLCYFTVYGKDERQRLYVPGLGLRDLLQKDPLPGWLKTNRYEICRYLGGVNLVSLFPTFIIIGGIALGWSYIIRALQRQDERHLIVFLLYVVVLVSAAAFFYFLVMYPNPKGDNLKATYLLQIFPSLAICAGEFLCQIRRRSLAAAVAIIVALLLVAAHNVPACITHYTPW